MLKFSFYSNIALLTFARPRLLACSGVSFSGKDKFFFLFLFFRYDLMQQFLLSLVLLLQLLVEGLLRSNVTLAVNQSVKHSISQASIQLSF